MSYSAATILAAIVSNITPMSTGKPTTVDPCGSNTLLHPPNKSNKPRCTSYASAASVSRSFFGLPPRRHQPPSYSWTTLLLLPCVLRAAHSLAHSSTTPCHYNIVRHALQDRTPLSRLFDRLRLPILFAPHFLRVRKMSCAGAILAYTISDYYQGNMRCLQSAAYISDAAAFYPSLRTHSFLSVSSRFLSSRLSSQRPPCALIVHSAVSDAGWSSLQDDAMIPPISCLPTTSLLDPVLVEIARPLSDCLQIIHDFFFSKTLANALLAFSGRPGTQVFYVCLSLPIVCTTTSRLGCLVLPDPV